MPYQMNVSKRGRMRALFVAACISVIVMRSWSQTATSASSRIHDLYLADQSENPGNISEADYYKHGDARRAEIRQMLDGRQVQSGSDFHDAAAIYQHGRSADDYLLAHILAIEAMSRGDNSSKWFAAATLDRYLQKLGQPQIFGTQFPADPKAPKSPPKQQVDVRVANVIRTQAPFDPQLVPASLRKDFCVPDLAQQQKNLAIFNTGHYPENRVTPDCGR